MIATKRQYTIRGVLSEVVKALRKAAKDRHLSLNQFLVQELERVAGETHQPIRYHDLDSAIGSMKDGDLVDEAPKEFGRIDEGLWK